MNPGKWETISTLTEAQIEDLCRMYQQEWWSKGRQKVNVTKMLENSDVIIALSHPQSQEIVAFARVITDYVYRGFILDVIVQSAYRGQGLGKSLMEAIINHPQLKEVETLILLCQLEMVNFYQKWGFTTGKEDICVMGLKQNLNKNRTLNKT